MAFKIGQNIFEKIKSPLIKFGEDLKVSFFDLGKESGKAFIEGVKQGAEQGKAEAKP